MSTLTTSVTARLNLSYSHGSTIASRRCLIKVGPDFGCKPEASYVQRGFNLGGLQSPLLDVSVHSRDLTRINQI